MPGAHPSEGACKGLGKHSSVFFLESMIYYKMNNFIFKCIFTFIANENETTEFYSNFTGTFMFSLRCSMRKSSLKGDYGAQWKSS